MDATTRLFQVYAKTPAGNAALSSARGTLAPSSRQLLILVDGNRSIADLASIFDPSHLELALAQLEEHGLIELMRHIEPETIFVETSFPDDMGRAPRRNSASGMRGIRIVLSLFILAGLALATVLWVYFRPEKQARVPLPETPASETLPASPIPAPAAPASHAPLPVRPPAPAKLPKSATPQAPKVQAATPVSPPPDVVRADAPLKVRNQVTPQIPKALLDRGILSGDVTVVLFVTSRGEVSDVRLVNAMPPELYDENMHHAFEKWTFEPLGRPGRMTVQIEVHPPK